MSKAHNHRLSLATVEAHAIIKQGWQRSWILQRVARAQNVMMSELDLAVSRVEFMGNEQLTRRMVPQRKGGE
jgi:hypothetical protein